MSVRHIFVASTLLLVCTLSHRATAQSTTSLLPDATVLPGQSFRLRVLTSFTRYDALLGGDPSPRNIGSLLATDSLGVAQVPAFSAIQTAIQDASGLSNFRLTAGQIGAVADSRIVTAPLIIEYGVTSRLTLGVVVPLVETRTSIAVGLNQQPAHANVGLNPVFGSRSVATANGVFVASVLGAATALQNQLAQCQTSPSSAGCPALLSQQAAAQSLIQSSTAFAAAIARLYGTSPTTGQALIPLDSSQSQRAIAAKIQNLRDQYQALLGSDPITGTVSGAHGPAAFATLQSLLTALGRDTLRSTDHSSIGDITIGASYQIANTFADTTAGGRGRHYRLTANGTFRIGTGQPANRNRFFDVATGYGQPGIEAGIAGDLQLTPRVSASAIGSYTQQLGSVAVNAIPNAGNLVFPLDVPVPGSYVAGNVMCLSVNPRYRLAGYFAITGRYSVLHATDDHYTAAPSAGATGTVSSTVGTPASTAQHLGIGFTYSTVAASVRGPGRLPFEVSFDHLETIAASGGPTAKTSRDQLELRVYLSR